MNDESLKNQKIAADPKLSVWVSASAGTGKTTVLVNRLLRLFLNGVSPSKILCLTYTNAGAINMQNRIYEKTKKWAVISDDELTGELSDLLSIDDNHKIDTTTDDFKNLFTRARKLFSRLVDNPIPLKIYTIHAFCQSVLKRFPIEAGIAPHFTIIEDSEVKQLLNKSYQILVSSVKKQKDDLDVFNGFTYLMQNTPESSFDDLIQTIIDGREHFFNLISKYHTKDKIKDELKGILFKNFNPVIDDFINDEKLYLKNVISHIPVGFIDDLKSAFACDTSSTVSENLSKLNSFTALSTDDERVANFDIYKSIFLTKDNKVKSQRSIITKKCLTAHPNILDYIMMEGERIRSAVEFVNLSKVFITTSAVIDIGLKLNSIYENLKSKQGVMDFTDLITTVRKLFSRPNICEWILYKLDGGISHVLIDEAQDTSPIQWEIVDTLTNEFFTTGRTEKELKSFFSVGDRKQSIFSFQGANIRLFEQYKKVFADKIEYGKYPFYNLPLNRSFRSCKNILNTVDTVNKQILGVLIDNEKIEHIPNRKDSDGYVELLPLIKNIDDTTKDCFKPPVENVVAFNSSVEMASILAKKIRHILDNEFIFAGKKDDKTFIRRIEPQDIMILVRKRKFAGDITNALISAGIPISGQDKISLSDNIVVQDLISLLKFVLFNYDDLSLAEVLKSPLYNLNDDDLFTLCYDRGGRTLFEQLSQNERYKNVYDDLTDLVEFSSTALPFEFFDYVLKVKDKRRNFISRFGSEIDDILNGFLAQCLSYDNLKLGKSLSDFYEWFSLSNVELKRNMEQVNNCVRIMTVHSSKGLEAPIVFLYNANAPLAGPHKNIVWYNDFPVYKITSFQNINDVCENIYTENKRADLEEFYRLLYVAMTRAKDRLYVIGAENKKSSSDISWYSCIESALKENPNTKQVYDSVLDGFSSSFTDNNKSLVLGCVNEEGEPLSTSDISLSIKGELPKFLETPVENNLPKYNVEIDTSSPFASDDDDEAKALSRGTIIHKLLEYLSRYRGDDVHAFISNYLNKFDLPDAEKIRENVLELYNNPQYNFIFDDNSLSETEIITFDNGISKILRVDKVVFIENDIWIIDYKTDKNTPDTIPSMYKKQLLKYRDAMSKVYPDKKIHTAILWVNTLKLQEFI